MKEYKNEHITVHWFPEKCAHPGTCLRLSPEVFNLKQRPWVNVDAAEPEAIIRTIDKCPSGALRYSIPEGSKVDAQIANGAGNINSIRSNGSLLDGEQASVIGDQKAPCRCGRSKNLPFCDGTHLK